MKEENDKKIAEKFAKMMEATVAATDLSGKAAEAQIALEAMNNRPQYEQVIENKKTAAISPSDLAQKKADGITSQIETANNFHEDEKKKKIDDFIKNEKTSLDNATTDKSKVMQMEENNIDTPKKTLDKFSENKNDITDKEDSKVDTFQESEADASKKTLDKFNQNKEELTDKKDPKTDDFKENKMDILNNTEAKQDAFTENKNDITKKNW